jgi:CDP-paratose 2-epimerase
MNDTVLITGGCGFIGSNLAAYLLTQGVRVRVFDSLARPGSERNAAWLASLNHSQLEVVQGDVRDSAAVAAAMLGVQTVVHLAAQVAVTRSVEQPRYDFEVNALGTLNVLEAARSMPTPPLIIYTSTNKVYGDTRQIVIEETDTRYIYADRRAGIDENLPLDFHSPYGCSKGSADQYVLDYARIYGVPGVVLRMSCIYGPHQFGNEDQGWVAHFLIRALAQQPITIYGNGKQVRDLLYVDDLLRLFWMIHRNPTAAVGHAFNIGGGAERTISIWREFAPLIAQYTHTELSVSYGEWRPGDQRVYISDIGKAQAVLGWQPQVSIADGVQRMQAWLRAHHPDLAS